MTSSELTEVRETIRKHVDRVERLTVRAPTRGRVQHVLQRSTGEVVRPGETIAQIVPIGELLVAEVHVKTEDIAVVKVGDPAELKVTAYDFSKYGKMKGAVASISPAPSSLTTNAPTTRSSSGSIRTARTELLPRGSCNQVWRSKPISYQAPGRCCSTC